MANAKIDSRPAAVRGDTPRPNVWATVFSGTRGGKTDKGSARFTVTATGPTATVLAQDPSRIGPLLQGFGEAVARSQATGQAVRLQVDVAPDGTATVSHVNPATASASFPVETVADPDPALQAALAAARARGRVRAGEILAGADMVNAEELAKLLGTTRVTVNAKRRNGQVLGLEGARRGFRFPVWQINADGKPYAALPTLLKHLGAPWAVYRFLIQPHGALDGLTGRRALEEGREEEVVAAAAGMARGDFS
ncbi:MAG: hypothetical protein RLY86_4462 [Pseudomonadota bacterium]|jgi:hypothetical protein